VAKISQTIKDLRKLKGWSMEKLAQSMGVSEAYISLIESGKRQPSYKVTLKLAQSLADSDSQVQQIMHTAGYPEIQSNENKPVLPASFTEFMQKVFLDVRHGRYAEAEQAITQGLQTFHDTVQIQMLIAHLELARQHTQLAIHAMETALNARETYPDSQVPFVDIYLNLGVCHFMHGSQQIPVDAELAVNHFHKAVHYFELTLKSEPYHVYALDEYARCLYNLAHFEAQDWQEVVEIYARVLAVRDLELPLQTKKEALCFYALAQTRAGHHELGAALFASLLFLYQDAYVYHAYLCHCCYVYLQAKQRKALSHAKAELERFLLAFPEQLAVLKADPELEILFK